MERETEEDFSRFGEGHEQPRGARARRVVIVCLSAAAAGLIALPAVRSWQPPPPGRPLEMGQWGDLTCDTDTGGTCRILECAPERNAACDFGLFGSHKCYCPAGRCVDRNGHCKPKHGRLVASDIKFSNKVWPDQYIYTPRSMFLSQQRVDTLDKGHAYTYNIYSLPSSSSSNGQGDDSCKYAKNGVCDSTTDKYDKPDGKCAAATDVTDCGDPTCTRDQFTFGIRKGVITTTCFDLSEKFFFISPTEYPDFVASAAADKLSIFSSFDVEVQKWDGRDPRFLMTYICRVCDGPQGRCEDGTYVYQLAGVGEPKDDLFYAPGWPCYWGEWWYLSNYSSKVWAWNVKGYDCPGADGQWIADKPIESDLKKCHTNDEP